MTDPDIFATPSSGTARSRAGLPDKRATYYCMWCRWPLADDGRTRVEDLRPLEKDECALLRVCDECREYAWVRSALKARHNS